METSVKEQMGNTNKEGKETKRKWGKMILHFLMYGGWLLVIVIILVVVVLISVLSK